jgi:hypothetical protein
MIYCEPKTDEVLLGEIGDSKKVFLLGCSLCANISYCIHNHMQTPMYQGLEACINVKREAKRLKQVLAEQGVQTGSATLISLCCISSKDVKKVTRKSAEYDTVVTLSCEFGRRNTEDYLQKKRVVGAMKNRGLMRTIVDQKGLTIRFVKDRLYVNNKKYSG